MTSISALFKEYQSSTSKLFEALSHRKIIVTIRLHMHIKDLLRNTSAYQTARELYRSARYPKPTHRKQLGTVLSFKDVPIVPYQELQEWQYGRAFHKGGPIWPNWTDQLDARHCRNGVPMDVFPDIPDHFDHQIVEPAAWCGAVCDHFGHQIADFSTRILHTRSAYPDAKLVFSTKNTPQHLNYAKSPGFFQDILAWFDIDLNDIELITQPTMVNELLVAPQAEQLLSYGPSSEYLDLLDVHVERRLRRKPRQKAVFISRAGMKAHFAGEAYLETLIRQAGIKVIRPETLPLQEQLAEYEASERLIFSEGSAFHGLQLLGRCLNHIHILNRRPGARVAQNLLNVRANRLSYIEVSCGLVCGLWPNGKPEKQSGMSILNEEAIVKYLGSIDRTLKKRWDHAAYLKARDEDVLTWLQVHALGEIADSASTKATIIEKLQEVGLSHLIASANTILPG